MTRDRASTFYVYRVGEGVNWCAWIHFRTASAELEPFTLISSGDAQNALKAHWSRLFRQAFTTAPAARFILHARDLVKQPGAPKEQINEVPDSPERLRPGTRQ